MIYLNPAAQTLIRTCLLAYKYYNTEQRQSKESAVKLWLSRLKEILYEADDLFDAIVARDLHKQVMDGNTYMKEVLLFFSKYNHLGFIVNTLLAIKDIRGCLDSIKDDMSPFHFQYREEKHTHSVFERKERHSFVNSKDVIGRDQEKKDIINLLLSDDCRPQSLEVISVIGFGGLGKTTLAQFVYNEERVQTGFDICLWVCINYLSDLESVLAKILECRPQEFHLHQLRRKLSEKIKGKKYLLVLDDVRDENASNWDELKTLLSCGKTGSKVLITTRETKVAQCLDAAKPYYSLKMLSEEGAWSLFVKMAFKDGEFDGDSELVLVGKKIIQKCGYVPLALSTIGHTLRYRKKDKEEWLSFLEKELVEVVSSDVDIGNLMHVLKVSFNDMPLALKRCFAYCSVFPKDYEFDKDELVRMWIAQGFVEPHARKSLEEVGDDYFFYIADRCFFREVQKYEQVFGVSRHTCKMHHLLHDLAIQVTDSGSNSVLDKDLSEMVERSDVLYHISITFSRESPFDYSKLSPLSNSLRTLRLVNTIYIKTDPSQLVLDRFRKLRTLVISQMEIGTLPDIFEELIHLRYLDLSKNSNLAALPNSVCKLYHLQTLLLTKCPSLEKLPSNLSKLVSLRHLFLEGCTLESMPSGFATLTKLVNLDWFIVHPGIGGLRYLGLLDKLCGTLKLKLPKNGWIDCVDDAIKASMRNKCRLRGLSIECSNEAGEGELSEEERKELIEELRPHANLQYLRIEYYIGEKLPYWFSSLSNIKKLSLETGNLEFFDVSVSSGYLLPCLEVLQLFYMRRLRGWWSGATSASPRANAPMSSVLTLPRAWKLEIKGCANLVENMPVFAAVQELTLEKVNMRLVNMLLDNPNVNCSPQHHEYNNKLQVLYLERITGLECLSEGSMKHLTALKRLSIFYCENLRRVSRRGLACLTSLEELTIHGCGVVRLEDEDDKRPYLKINNNYGLHRLRKLRMPWQCHFLREELHFLSSLQFLEVEYYDEKQVEADNQELECCTLMWWKGLNKLQTVHFSFGWIKCCFPKWILHLPCLKELNLFSCGEMNIDEWVAHQTQLNSLEHFYISSNKELLWVHDIPWDLLPSLSGISINLCLNTLPPRIQQLASLQSLYIWDCRGLKEIPKWMMNLTSLQVLSIVQCSSELKARCEPETGGDWHLISHIRSISIY